MQYNTTSSGRNEEDFMSVRTFSDRDRIVSFIRTAGTEIADRAEEITPDQIEKVRSITIKIELYPNQMPTLSWKVEGNICR